jgi:hypothetical protein
MYQYTSTGYKFVDYEGDAPPDRCPGPAYDNARGCGRFLAEDTWMCGRCKAESNEYWKADSEREAQLEADMLEAQRLADKAYWEGDGARLLEEQRAWLAECADSLPIGPHPVLLPFDDDLPY